MNNNANFLPIGSTLNNGAYRVDKYLASGGFGNTYVVTHQNFQKQFVMKELFLKGINERDDDNTTVSVSNANNKDQFEQQRRKFLKEARRLSDLRNKHIVMVHDLFDDNATAYYVMDYIQGESLRDKIVRQGGGLGNQAAWNCLNQMLEALEDIHAKSIWHLDIKPGNIMCDSNGHLTLIDFGASKMIQGDGGAMTTSTATAYTPGYAPIEQVTQKVENYGPWTDFYALGATLYHVLTGNKPPVPDEIVENGAQAFEFPANADGRLSQLVVWMMQINRTKRPQSVAAIRQWLGGNEDLTVQQPSAFIQEQTVIPGGPVYVENQAYDETLAVQPNSSKSKKLIWLWPVLAVALCLLVVGGYFGYKAYQKSRIDYTTYNPDLVAAADDGDAEAQAALGDCYFMGYGVTIDDKQAFELYKKSADQDNALGLYGLGSCYYNGRGIERDTVKGNDYFAQAGKKLVKMEDSDNPRVLTALGVCYQSGYGVEENKTEAVEWYRKAAEQGNDMGQKNLGYCYEKGYGVPQDYNEAVKWYRKAAEQGNAGAQCNLGYCYDEGVGVAKDDEEAVKWYRKAAEQGHARAQCNLGWCYDFGEGVVKDDEEAVRWYRKAAEQGYADAQYNLGLSYKNGEGVPQDYTEAVKWYRKAAEQGNALAQNNLGVCYAKGQGVPRDENEAIKWYQKAARQGNAIAQQNLRSRGKSW